MNIIEYIERNSSLFPDKTAYTQVDKTGELRKISYRDFEQEVNKVASFMEEYQITEDKVIIMLQSSIEYIITFLGVMKAGIITVPAYPITSSHHRERLESILQDSQAGFIITDKRTKDKMEKYFTDLVENLVIIDVQVFQEMETVEYEGKPIDMEDVAYLQYTSGSTSNAKGVMITHRNIIANEQLIQRSMELGENEKIVTWLPFYHDMGLIGNIILTMYLGASCYFMSPIDFIQSPVLWLKTVSRVGGTFLTAPNFAFQMCVDEISDKEAKGLSLSSLKNVINGAEPVRLNTLEAFSQRFYPYGFVKSAMKPSFGLAENTLLAATYRPGEEYRYKIVNQEKLSEGILEYVPNGVKIVASGHIIEGVEIVIADVKSQDILEERKIGEILISSDSATQGYWNNQKLNEEIFRNYIEGHRYFRTGDLGYLDEKHLYIVGRIKDVIIIRGRNYYPQDLELVMECKSKFVKKDSSAAFSVTVENEERLVLVGEVDKSLRNKKNDSDSNQLENKNIRKKIIEDIYKAVIESCSIEPYDILLIQEKSIPKTSSGKIQRQMCKREYICGNLKTWERMRTTVYE